MAWSNDLNIYSDCIEKGTGNTPRSIMTKGNSISYGTRYGNFIRGNNDKLMISYRRESSHDYTMNDACGVLFEGEMHFFGGDMFFRRQHFVIETQRSGQLVKMTKKLDLEMEYGFTRPSCSSFELISKYFPWFNTNVVILCFDFYHENSCHLFDGKLTYIGDSNFYHYHGKHSGGLTKYKNMLMTIGPRSSANNQRFGSAKQTTELMKVDGDQNFSWSVVEQNYTNFIEFAPGNFIEGHSLVTVEASDINEEYVLLIGGRNEYYWYYTPPNVFKFNGTWFAFGKLNKPRYDHSSIYWNGAVYVIGGTYNDDSDVPVMVNQPNLDNTKMEVWNVKDSPDQFNSNEINWPELALWRYPHLFIIPDSYFPDY